MASYTPEEQLAARIIASLIYPDWPSGPDLETDIAPLGLYGHAVESVRWPYLNAADMMPLTGRQYDCPGDAAMAWEGLRQMTGAATPYARLDPIIRELGGAVQAPQQEKPRPRAKAKPEYVMAEPGEMPESQLIIERLKTLGWTFRLNRCADTVEVNGHPISEIVAAEIRVALRDIGLAKKLAAAEDAYVAEAKKNAYHPVQDYLNALKWDGEDHIGALAACLHSSDPPIVYRDKSSLPLPHVYLYRWLLGAVAKVFTGSQNPMLVWDGPQGIGKSTLARWLCPLAEFFIEGPINVGDKDSDIRLMTQLIWEVSELDATTRKADQSALKSFITKQVVTVRPSYGRHDIKKLAMASLIGTVNNTSGFLADETGSRRFLITRLERIDRAYQKLDVDQVWAQAVALYREGETGTLTPEESTMQNTVNEGYEAQTVLADWLDRSFTFHPDYDELMSSADIIAQMGLDGFHMSGSERVQQMELARVLKRKHVQSKHTRDGNRWYGLQRRPRT